MATYEALEHACIDQRTLRDRPIPVFIGNGSGGFASAADWFADWDGTSMRGLDRLGLIKALPDMAAANISLRLATTGRLRTITASCSSASLAIADAAEFVRSGGAELAIAGGTEAWLTRFGVAAFAALGATTTRNCPAEEASCPFDSQRDGFVPAEGAAILILESYSHAIARGASFSAELAGAASNADAHNILAPDPSGDRAARCMRDALDNAGVRGCEVDYINAHGTSTQFNDAAETRAIRLTLGRHADSVAISSTKSMLGHTLGASGAIEALVAVKTIETGVIHPTINLRNPDPACDLDYVPNVARRADVRCVLSNSFAFGGQNACLVVTAPEYASR